MVTAMSSELNPPAETLLPVMTSFHQLHHRTAIFNVFTYILYKFSVLVELKTNFNFQQDAASCSYYKAFLRRLSTYLPTYLPTYPSIDPSVRLSVFMSSVCVCRYD